LGGWFLDAYIAYIFKVLVRLLKPRGSSGWTTVNGTVSSSSWSAGGFGCSSAEVAYTYRFRGELYSGLDEVPFVSPSSAEKYAGRFQPGMTVAVRVKSVAPEISVIRQADQHDANPDRGLADHPVGIEAPRKTLL
jgi:hypothetical protein